MNVEELADWFSKTFSFSTAEQPLLKLDFTWPSVSLLDQISFHLRYKETLDEAEKQLLRGLSAYLGVMAKESWESFGAEVELQLSEQGVTIVAKAGPALDGKKEFRVSIEQRLQEILREIPPAFPVIGEFERQISPDQDLFPLFALGLFTGLCPFGEGPWTHETFESFEEPLSSVHKMLAKSCATFYERVFPNEQLGQVAELYLLGFIYPPTLLGETFPGVFAVEGFFQTLTEFGISFEQSLALIDNLCTFPDERIMCVALALRAAMNSERIPPRVIAAAQSRGTIVGLYRGAVFASRNASGAEQDWVNKEELSLTDLTKINVEKTLGFLPWVFFSADDLKDSGRRDVALSLMLFDYSAAKRKLDNLIEQDRSDISSRLQLTFLELVTGHLDVVKELIAQLKTEPGCERNPNFLNLAGVTCLALEELSESKLLLKQAFELTTSSDALFPEIANNYAWTLLLNDEFDAALKVLNSLLNKHPQEVTALLNKGYALDQLGRKEELLDLEAELVQLAPLDKRFFANLQFRSLSSST